MQDKAFVGNIVDAVAAYGRGDFDEPEIPLSMVDRLVVIGSDAMMGAVARARHTVLAARCHVVYDAGTWCPSSRRTASPT